MSIRNSTKSAVLFTLFSIILLSSCCLLSSKDCGCEPPDKELTAEAQKWITPYDGKEFLTFKDYDGNIDSLRISRTSDTDFFGGEECGTDAQVEIAQLSSDKYHDILFTTTAKENRRIIFNNELPSDQFLGCEFFADDDHTVFARNNSSAEFKPDFQWNGLPITAINIRCAAGSNCDTFQMQNIMVSKEIGLLQYTTKDGRRWSRFN